MLNKLHHLITQISPQLKRDIDDRGWLSLQLCHETVKEKPACTHSVKPNTMALAAKINA